MEVGFGKMLAFSGVELPAPSDQFRLYRTQRIQPKFKSTYEKDLILSENRNWLIFNFYLF